MSSFTLEQLAELTQGKIIGDPHTAIVGVADLAAAQKGQIAFFANRRYLDALEKSTASAIIVDPEAPLQPGQNYLVVPHPSDTFQAILRLFFSEKKPFYFEGVHPTAIIAEDVRLSEGVTVGPHAVIDRGSTIGKNTKIGPGVLIGPFVTIGEECLLHSGSIIRESCTLHNRIILQPGAIIGCCGFGFFTDEKGFHHKQEQLGTVIIEDDVEIGSLSTIDRGRFEVTRIKQGTKIGNLVQVAHNVEIGAHNLIVSQTGIAGSSKTGHHVIIAGQVGLVGHVTIADGVMLAARSGISKSIKEPGSKWAGAPALPLAEHHRQSALLRNIDKHVARIKELEERLSRLENELGKKSISECSVQNKS